MYVVSKRNRIVKPLRIEALRRANTAGGKRRRSAENDNYKPKVRAKAVIAHIGLDFETVVTAQLLSQQTPQMNAPTGLQSLGIDAYQSALDRKNVRLENGTYYRDKA